MNIVNLQVCLLGWDGMRVHVCFGGYFLVGKLIIEDFNELGE